MLQRDLDLRLLTAMPAVLSRRSEGRFPAGFEGSRRYVRSRVSNLGTDVSQMRLLSSEILTALILPWTNAVSIVAR